MLSQPGEAAERSAQARAARALSGARPAPSRSPRRRQHLPPGTPPEVSAQSGRGRPLRPAEATDFESRLGADLGHVRVHDDAAAAALAEAAHARAFTLGSHVFFNRGEYQPGTRGGRALLAHELAHVAESPPGPAQLMRQPKPDVATRRKAPLGREKAPDPQNLALEAGDVPDADEAVTEQLTTIIALAVSQPGYPSLLTMRSHWHEAFHLITKPKGLDKPAPGTLFADLHDPDLAAQLGALTPDARLAVAAEVQRRVIGMLQSNPLTKLKEEFGQLKSSIKDNLDGGFLGWVAMREGMFRCFVDIPHMNEYYASLVPADFPSPTVKGHQTLVHPTLKAKLDRARDLITRNSWMPEVEAALSPLGLWATEIRENTAHPADIGSHAFGWAIDIAPSMNPDIRPFPEIFADVIGTDAGAGPSVMALRDPKISTAKALTEAKVLRASSDAIVAAFANKDAVVNAISGYLSRHGAGTLDAADRKALTALLDATAATKGKKGKDAATAAVTDWVLTRQDRARSAQQFPATDPDGPATKYSSTSREDSLWVIRMTRALRQSSRSQADLDARLVLIERQIDAPVSHAPKQAHDLGLDAIYGPSSAAALKAMDAEHKYYAMIGLRNNLQMDLDRRVATDTAARVLEIHQLFLSAEQIRHTSPEIRPAAAGVAAHGWLSLPPVLIASLVSEEGAGLMWLGVMITESQGRKLGAKDSMHFEIRPGDRPMLPAGRYPDVLGHPAKSPGDFVSPDDAETA
jgi:hypothetical protein